MKTVTAMFGNKQLVVGAFNGEEINKVYNIDTINHYGFDCVGKKTVPVVNAGEIQASGKYVSFHFKDKMLDLVKTFTTLITNTQSGISNISFKMNKDIVEICSTDTLCLNLLKVKGNYAEILEFCGKDEIQVFVPEFASSLWKKMNSLTVTFPMDGNTAYMQICNDENSVYSFNVDNDILFPNYYHVVDNALCSDKTCSIRCDKKKLKSLVALSKVTNEVRKVAVIPEEDKILISAKYEDGDMYVDAGVRCDMLNKGSWELENVYNVNINFLNNAIKCMHEFGNGFDFRFPKNDSAPFVFEETNSGGQYLALVMPLRGDY